MSFENPKNKIDSQESEEEVKETMQDIQGGMQTLEQMKQLVQDGELPAEKLRAIRTAIANMHEWLSDESLLESSMSKIK